MRNDTLDNFSLIKDLEKEIFPKLNMTWGFHAGFIYRVQVFYLHYLIKSNTFKYSLSGPLIKLNWRSTIKFVRSLLGLMKFYLGNKRRFAADVLIVGYKKNSSDYGGENLNVYTDPINRKLRERGVKTLTFYFDGPSPGVDTELDLYNYFKYLSFIKSVVFRLLTRFSRHHKDQFRLLKQNENILKTWLENKGVEKSFEISRIISNAILSNEIIYRSLTRLCNVVNPKLIWTYCFYDNSISALTRVANKRHIKLVEYQHSQQSDHHFVYSPWGNVDAIKDFLPTTFWVWRDSDRQRILKNFLGVKYKPEALAGGNVWLASYKKMKTRNSSKNSVLVSLQGFWIPDFIENYIISDDKYTWYFRLHPRYPGDKTKLSALAERFPKKIESEKANSLPLYDLLTMVSMNITSYSGVALEAYAFGVKNIIFGDQGFGTFQDYIQEGVFDFVDDQQSLAGAMNSVCEKSNFDPILTDLGDIDRHLSSLLS